jgi:nucleotide-binding universal stress UspA family protein
MNRATQQILIAVDGSEPSTWALDVGGRLAVERDAAVTVLHVIAPPTISASEIAPYAGEAYEQIKAGGEETLDAAVRRLDPSIQVHPVLREGYPAREITAMARELGADFVVIGSRGRGRLSHFILGSIAEAVIREAPCPVVSVSHDPGVGAWGTGSTVRRPTSSASLTPT